MMKSQKGAPLIDRLMRRCIPEPNSGCWLWEGSTNGRGYGLAFLPGGKRVTGAHRAMLMAHGVEVTDRDVVMHACDMPSCVNPDHLRVGTQGDNMADMNRKGRHRPAHKISLEWRQRIREDDTPAWAVAAWFGVDRKTINNIRRGA
jgi:HNH endonuclease